MDSKANSRFGLVGSLMKAPEALILPTKSPDSGLLSTNKQTLLSSTRYPGLPGMSVVGRSGNLEWLTTERTRFS